MPYQDDQIGAFESEHNHVTEEDFEREQKKAEQRLKEREAEETYDDGTPFDLNFDEFVRQHKDWFSNIAAVDLISTKNIDVFISDKKLNKDMTETLKFDRVLKKDKLEIKIFDLAKKVALSGMEALWFEPMFIQEKDGPKYSLSSQINIIQLKIVNNVVQGCTFLVNIVQGVAIGSVFAMVEATKDKFITRWFNMPTNYKLDPKDAKEFSQKNLDKETTPEKIKELVESIQDDRAALLVNYLNTDHNLGFVPVFPLYFNESYNPIIRNIDQDLLELFSIAQKRYDEAHLMGSKVIELNQASGETEANNQKVSKNMKLMASRSVLMGSDNMDYENARVNISVESKPPLYDPLNSAYKQKLNYILKTIGLSSDTDSKGTVQQSINEIIRQNEYSYNHQNYRNVILQNYLQNLLEKFYRACFGVDDKVVTVVSSQSLGMSEMEKLNYVINAKNNGVMDQATAISIITGKNYADSYALAKLKDMKDNISSDKNISSVPEDNKEGN